jgi:hypothetical protein
VGVCVGVFVVALLAAPGPPFALTGSDTDRDGPRNV